MDNANPSNEVASRQQCCQFVPALPSACSCVCVCVFLRVCAPVAPLSGCCAIAERKAGKTGTQAVAGCEGCGKAAEKASVSGTHARTTTMCHALVPATSPALRGAGSLAGRRAACMRGAPQELAALQPGVRHAWPSCAQQAATVAQAGRTSAPPVPPSEHPEPAHKQVVLLEQVQLPVQPLLLLVPVRRAMHHATGWYLGLRPCPHAAAQLCLRPSSSQSRGGSCGGSERLTVLTITAHPRLTHDIPTGPPTCMRTARLPARTHERRNFSATINGVSPTCAQSHRCNAADACCTVPRRSTCRATTHA